MEELVTFETAELAKQKGFNESTIDWFEKRINGKWEEEYPQNHDFGYSSYNTKENTIARPTQAMLQKWLREEHKIFLNSITGHDLGTRFQIYYEEDRFTYDELYTDMYEKYELALEAGLKEGIKKIK